MTTDTPTSAFNPVELTFIGALASDRIDQIDVDIARMRAEAERLGVPLDVSNLELARSIYSRIVATIEAALASTDRALPEPESNVAYSARFWTRSSEGKA